MQKKLKEVHDFFSKWREAQRQNADEADADNPTIFNSAPELRAMRTVLWDVAGKLLADCAEKFVEGKLNNPAYFYTLFMRSEATNENIIGKAEHCTAHATIFLAPIWAFCFLPIE